MRQTVVEIEAGDPVALVTLRGGGIVPRLVARGHREATVALVAGEAMLLAGDRVSITIVVGAGCLLDLRDIGGTVAYDADGQPCWWSADIRLSEDSELLWHGLPLVVSHGALVHRSVHIDLGKRSRALLRDTIVLGRSGEIGGTVLAHTSACDPDGPLLEERVDAGASQPVPGVLGKFRVLDTVTMLGSWPPPGIEHLAFEQPGGLARYLGHDTHSSPMGGVWDRWASALAATAPDPLAASDVAGTLRERSTA